VGTNVHASQSSPLEHSLYMTAMESLWLFCWISITVLASCASNTPADLSSSANSPDGGHAISPAIAKQDANDSPTTNEKPSAEMCKVPELVRLWQERNGGPLLDLPVGPGDVIDVSVPEIDEIQNQKVRVSAQGTISLPLIGSLEVAGLSENELRDAIDRRLKRYMKNPRVELFVENYRSRGVAVMGAVQKPGNYDMADERDSVVDMIGLAGGLSPTAAQKVVYSPAEAGRFASGSSIDRSGSGLGSDGEIASARGVDGVLSVGDAQAGGERLVKASASPTSQNSIVLNLDLAGEEACLGLPARPGDVIVVPVAGQVMVQGWVRNPGAFAVTPGMTLLGAVSAAGGAVFSWKAELLRGDAHGNKRITEYSLPQLESGEQHDPSVQSGDVVLVEKTAVGAVPYSLYFLVSHFGTGLAFPIP
jgi:protein involved in polysaccharide export with SLBB domain